MGFKLIFDDQPVFLQCFDIVGLVIWPVRIVPEMTYYMSSGTLNPTHSPHPGLTYFLISDIRALWRQGGRISEIKK